MPSRYGLSVRAAEAGDVDGLAELLRAADVAVPRERLAARLAAVQAQPGVVLLAQEWGPPTGLIVLHWSAVLTADLKVGRVDVLLVDPERRRSGVARLLLKAASQAARAAGCGALVMAAEAEGSALHDFCLATGFVEAERTFTRSLRKRG